MSVFLPEKLLTSLRSAPRRWLLTGAAGFIGSNLLEALLECGQEVVAIDNFSTGSRKNIDEVRSIVGTAATQRLRFIEGSVADARTVAGAMAGVDVVCHQAALGSVPRSVEDPLASNEANVTGFVTVLDAARRAGVRRIVYASSSSVYGDGARGDRPSTEDDIGKVLSPYAATKRANEVYADAFAQVYGLELVGLRYFNVFGPRQDPAGPYAAVIPRWVASILSGERCVINGDGQTTRDFCYVANVVQANLLAATVPGLSGAAVMNIAVGERTSLNELHGHLTAKLRTHTRDEPLPAEHAPFRPGDIRHSCADISRARSVLGYEPTHRVAEGLDSALGWYVVSLRR